MNQNVLGMANPDIVGGGARQRYGLVRQFGPWKPSETDIEELFAPPPYDPSDYQALQPDAVGPTDESLIPYQLGGGFSLMNGSVVDPPTYDPRFTVPGRRMIDARPMEEAGEVVALTGQTQAGVDFGVANNTPYSMPDPNLKVTLTDEDFKNITDIQAQIVATQQTGIGPFYDPSKMISVYNKMTGSERAVAEKALLTWKTMTARQKAQEFLNPNSIMRRIYTLYKAEMPAKYVALLVSQLADIAMFSMMF